MNKGKIACYIGLHKWNNNLPAFHPQNCLREGCKAIYYFNGMMGFYCVTASIKLD